jgi:hypothetical protein
LLHYLILLTLPRIVQALEAERNEAIKNGNFNLLTLEQSRTQQQWTAWYLAVQDYVLNPVNLYKLCYNYTPVAWATGPYEIQRTVQPVDLGQVLELLCKVHGNEIFEHGEHLYCVYLWCSRKQRTVGTQYTAVYRSL